MPDPPFPLAKAPSAGGFLHSLAPAGGARIDSLEEERREVVASVLAALAGNAPDPDQMAVCSRLLKHLADTAGSPGDCPAA